MLKLQNGKFDAPDRLFNGISDAWNSVNSNPADLKELIPEFYESNGEFLTNMLDLDMVSIQSDAVSKCSLVIIVRIVFIGSFLFYCLLSNHSFPTNPNSITNCFKLFFLLQLYNYIAPASLF